MQMKAISIANGNATTTTSALRNSPRNRNRMIATRIEPSIRARTAVPTAALTSSVRSYTGFTTTPGGNDCFTVSSLALTASTTLLAFSPMRANAMPRTTSSPSRVTAPVRGAPASVIVATSRTKTGVPSSVFSTMLPRSFASWINPRPRTRYCSRPTSTKLPPTCALFACSASITSLKPSLWAISFIGSMRTWNCFS